MKGLFAIAFPNGIAHKLGDPKLVGLISHFRWGLGQRRGDDVQIDTNWGNQADHQFWSGKQTESWQHGKRPSHSESDVIV